METVSSVSASDRPAALLLTDHDNQQQAALAQVLHDIGLNLLTAPSPSAARACLARQRVDLIISDIGLDGAKFLAETRQHYPETGQILLATGPYAAADSSAQLGSSAYRYVPKPWSAGELQLVVQQILENQALKRDNQRLRALGVQQNEQLRALTQDLAAQVSARAEDALRTLEKSQAELKQNFTTMLKVFSSIIEIRSGMLGGNSSRVAELAERLGRKLGLTEPQAQELMVAGLLHAIGKIGLPDELIRKPQDRMTAEENKRFLSHAAAGKNLLMPLESLAGVGHIIAHQFERYDGRGMPLGLQGAGIPLGARILAIARDFEALRSGAMIEKGLPEARIIAILETQRGLRYDPHVVDAFIALLGEPRPEGSADTRLITSQELRPGQQLAVDLTGPNGLLLLAKDSVMTRHYIKQIINFEEVEELQLHILIHR